VLLWINTNRQSNNNDFTFQTSLLDNFSHSFHSDLIHKFQRNITEISVTNIVVVEKPVRVSCVGRMHSSSSGTSAPALSTEHLSGDRDRLRLGQNVDSQVRVGIKTLYLSVLNFMKFLCV